MTTAKYRKQLPQLGPVLFLSDGGLETTLIFLEGLGLPDFAALDLLNTAQGEKLLTDYFHRYAEIARRFGTGLILESATWRANASQKSHAELKESSQLDIGDPVELGGQYAHLRKPLANLNVLGGCCGTDYRHVEQIAIACSPLFGASG